MLRGKKSNKDPTIDQSDGSWVVESVNRMVSHLVGRCVGQLVSLVGPRGYKHDSRSGNDIDEERKKEGKRERGKERKK